MTLDWPNERYVRLYTRVTPDLSCWRWEALAVWPWLLVNADRAGVIGTRKGHAGIAGLIRYPVEVTKAGIDELLSDGCLVAVEDGFLIRNYIDAQSAPASDTMRKAESRARHRALIVSDPTGRLCTEGHKNVTIGHAESRAVTSGHEMSLRSEPIRSDPIRTEQIPLTSFEDACAGAREATPSQMPSKRRKAKVAPQVPLPPSFEPTEAHRAKAKELGLNLQSELDAFRNFHGSKGSTFVDWSLAFHTWLGNAPKYGPSGPTNGRGAQHQNSQYAPMARPHGQAYEKFTYEKPVNRTNLCGPPDFKKALEQLTKGLEVPE